MISALCWVPKGVFKPLPSRVEPTEEELREAKEAEEAHGAGGATDEDEDEDLGESEDDGDPAARARQVAQSLATGGDAGGGGGGKSDAIEAAMRELDMDHYDDSDDENIVSRVLGGKRGGLATASKDPDDYITLEEEDDKDSEIEDLTIRPTDLLILAAKNEDEVSNLEVWLYEEAEVAGGEPNVYVHHDIMLPAFPLAVAWLDCDPSGTRERANMVAVATMDPGIEVWDLDLVDAVEPVLCLGGPERPASGSLAGSSGQGGEAEEAAAAAGGKKKKKKKTKARGPALVPGSHTDSVLCLSWCRGYRNVLASGSADHTVKVWDVSRGAAEHTLRHHGGKVQGVAWNPADAPVLLTGAFDKTACLVDVRSPSDAPPRWSLTADVEALTWHPHDPTCFLVSSEDGLVACFDARNGPGSTPLFRLHASDKPTCALSFCPAVPGLMATASTDKHIKLWDISSGTPSLVVSQELQIGALFTTGFSVDAPHLLAVGGAAGEVVVWDIRFSDAVTARYPQLRPRATAAAGEA